MASICACKHFWLSPSACSVEAVLRSKAWVASGGMPMGVGLIPPPLALRVRVARLHEEASSQEEEEGRQPDARLANAQLHDAD
eukprot:9456598-Alexandrium_andersonii.AAC.1